MYLEGDRFCLKKDLSLLEMMRMPPTGERGSRDEKSCLLSENKKG